MANSTFQERSIMRKIILALLFSLVVSPVFGKIITMNGVKYEVVNQPNGEMLFKPVDRKQGPKVTKLKPLGSVLNREPVKSEVIEKTETEAVYTEDICDDPMGCPQDIKTGDCPTCKKVAVYEKKEIHKVPTNEKIEHKIIKNVDSFYFPEGKYELIEKKSYYDGRLSQHLVFYGGLEYNYNKVKHNSYVWTVEGGSRYVDHVNHPNDSKAFACPIPTTFYTIVKDDGQVVSNKVLEQGTCGGIKSLSSSYKFDGVYLTKVKLLDPKCVAGCSVVKRTTEVFVYEFKG